MKCCLDDTLHITQLDYTTQCIAHDIVGRPRPIQITRDALRTLVAESSRWLERAVRRDGRQGLARARLGAEPGAPKGAGVADVRPRETCWAPGSFVYMKYFQ